MAESTLSVRINANDKTNFEKFCSETGMNVSVAINMFIKTVLRDQKLPFEIKSTSHEEYVYEKLKEFEEDYKKGAKTYSSEELFKSLESIINGVQD